MATLTSGVLSVTAAVITILYLMKVATAASNKKINAQRVLLLPALVEIHHYAKSRFNILENIYINSEKEEVSRDQIKKSFEDFSLFKLREEIIKSFGEIIEEIGDDEVSLSSIISEIQILESNLDFIKSDTEFMTLKVNLQSLIYKAVFIYASASRLFEYARGRGERAVLFQKVSRDDVQGAANNILFTKPMDSPLRGMLAKKIDRAFS